MKLNIHPTIIFRTPKFSLKSDLFDSWEELKMDIAISSDDFYQTIKEVKAEDLKKLPPKIYFTIWKYFNRAKFRSTPYGTFASFSIVEKTTLAQESEFIIDQEQKITELPDWPLKNELKFEISEVVLHHLKIFANSSFYQLPDSIRYIAFADGTFELAEIADDEFVLKVLNVASKPIAVDDLVQKLGLTPDELENFYSLLQDMHDLQLIFTEYDPNIIGEDYFKRIAINHIDAYPKYLIAERACLQANLNQQTFKHLPQLIDLLHQLMPKSNHESLVQFKNRLLQRFEEREIPLLVALDPELGVGYDELEQAGDGDDLFTSLQKKRKISGEDNQIKSQLSAFLAAQKFENGEAIHLNKFSINTSAALNHLPNTLSVMLTIADDLLFVEQIGGATANALAGRFSLASAVVEQYCKSVAKIEADANPDVLFFDVAYMAESTVDNINRRKSVYPAQLSILNYDTSNEPLLLNDILISVKGGEIVLKSKRLNKRILPKMASAYNYGRSDLSVFRFLSNLQNQNVQASLTINLEAIWPDLDEYPRLQYHNIVVCAAKWNVKTAHLTKADKNLCAVTECRDYLIQRGVSKYFKTGISDQTLCFNTDSDEDLTMFLQFIQKKEAILLQEVAVPETSITKDLAGQSYMAQFILNLHHREKIYHGILPSLMKKPVKVIFPPGTDWLYFEIFCHHQRADEILLTAIAAFLNTYNRNIEKWFFIRYNKNGNHLRFRILRKNDSNSGQLISAFVQNLTAYIDSGLVSDLQVKTYKREIERYGADLIEDVETHFGVDSDFVLAYLATQPDNLQKYKHCINLIESLVAHKVFSQDILAKIVKRSSDAFNDEHHLEATDFKKLNTLYQQFRNIDHQLFSNDQIEKFNYLTQSFKNILQACPTDRQIKLFGDLIHMHVNRLFKDSQRTHEMVMYYCLLKDILRRKAMAD